MSKPTDLGSLKIGSYILLPVSDQPTGDPCRITEYDTSKPGKHGAAKARIVGVGIFDGQKRPHVNQNSYFLIQKKLLFLKYLMNVVHKALINTVKRSVKIFLIKVL